MKITPRTSLKDTFRSTNLKFKNLYNGITYRKPYRKHPSP